MSIVVVSVSGATKSTDLNSAVGLLIEFVVNIGVLALAVCIASVLAGYRHKILSGLGIAGSMLVLIVWLWLVLVP